MAKFIYYNQNPDGNKENDCVTRAISLATNIKYSSIRKKLFHTAKLLDCEKLCHTCYSFLIENVLKCTPVNCDYMSVDEFAEINNKGIYLARMSGHITTIINGCIYDIWDCRDSLLTNAWKVKGYY